MDHEKCIELISCLLDGELSGQEERQMREHIAVCPECKKVYKAFSELSDSMVQLEEPPEGLHGEIMAAVQQRREKPKKTRVIWLRTLSAAACLALVVFAGAKTGLFNASFDSADDTASVGMTMNGAVESNGTQAADRSSDTENDALKQSAVAVNDAEKAEKLRALLEPSGDEKTLPDSAPDAVIVLENETEAIKLYFDGQAAFADFGGGAFCVKGSTDEIKALIN